MTIVRNIETQAKRHSTEIQYHLLVDKPALMLKARPAHNCPPTCEPPRGLSWWRYTRVAVVAVAVVAELS